MGKMGKVIKEVLPDAPGARSSAWMERRSAEPEVPGSSPGGPATNPSVEHVSRASVIASYKKGFKNAPSLRGRAWRNIIRTC